MSLFPSLGTMAMEATRGLAGAKSHVLIFRATDKAMPDGGSRRVHNETTALPVWEGDIYYEALRQNEAGEAHKEHGPEDMATDMLIIPPDCPTLKKGDMVVEVAVNDVEIAVLDRRKAFVDKEMPRGFDREIRLKEEGVRT